MSLLLIIDLVLNLNNLYVSDGWLYENPTIIARSPLFLIFEDILSKLEKYIFHQRHGVLSKI